MPESKADIRKRILSLRNTLDAQTLLIRSDAIFERIYALDRYKKAGVVLAYMDFRNEVTTGGFIQKCMREGKQVALPKVEAAGDSKDLSVYIVKDLDRDVQPGCMGIMEPCGKMPTRLDPREIDLAVIPGVAFDHAGNRIGYGAGYYDRFLRKLKKDCLKVGVAFSLQLVDAIPSDEHDMPVDMVATENLLISRQQNQ